MPEPDRRLAAVVAADMVGYSRLMEVDETWTLARLKTHRIELIDPVIERNRGRIIKTTRDGMLVEFHSVADAVLCAAEIQRTTSWPAYEPHRTIHDVLDLLTIVFTEFAGRRGS